MLGYISYISRLFLVVIVAFYLHTCCYAVILQFSCLTCYFSYLIFAVYLVIILCTLFYARAFPFTHTLTRSLSDDPGFARPDIGRFVSVVQVFVETVHFAKSWSFYLFDSGTLIFLAFVLFPDSCYIRSSRYSSS